MADLLACLAAARRARDDAERRLAAQPLDALDDILLGPQPRREVLVLHPRRTEIM